MPNLFSGYFPWLNTDQIEKLLHLESLYQEWNSKINVISRKDMEYFNIHHVLHSLSIAQLIRFKPGTSILDAGTGGGFPGIPLAIIFPNVHFTLADSTNKKIKVVSAIADSVQLKNVTSSWTRVEDLKEQFDFIISRAVTAFPKFVTMTSGLVKAENNNDLTNGIIYLKGGDLTAELGIYNQQVRIYNISDFYTEAYFFEKKIVYLGI